MSWWCLTWLSGSPGDAVPFDELDHVVLTDVAFRGRHDDDIADRVDSLPGSRPFNGSVRDSPTNGQACLPDWNRRTGRLPLRPPSGARRPWSGAAALGRGR